MNRWWIAAVFVAGIIVGAGALYLILVARILANLN